MQRRVALVASLKLPMFGSPVRLKASAPALAASRDMASALANLSLRETG